VGAVDPACRFPLLRRRFLRAAMDWFVACGFSADQQEGVPLRGRADLRSSFHSRHINRLFLDWLLD
jgi:hypothetical protein